MMLLDGSADPAIDQSTATATDEITSAVNRLLVCLSDDGGEARALAEAAKIADYHGAEASVVDVVPAAELSDDLLEGIVPVQELVDAIAERRTQELRQVIDDAAPRLDTGGGVRTLTGIPFIEIIGEAVNSRCDLILKTAEGRGSSGTSGLGSTDLHLLRKSPVPVMIVSHDRRGRGKQVLAAVDVLNSSPSAEAFNQRILTMAREAARANGASVCAVSAWHVSSEALLRRSALGDMDAEQLELVVRKVEEVARSRQKALKQWYLETFPDDEAPEFALVNGAAREAIPGFVSDRGIDLVVMGTVSRTDIKGLLIGNTAESVLGAVRCSVLALKPEGFITPVSLES